MLIDTESPIFVQSQIKQTKDVFIDVNLKKTKRIKSDLYLLQNRNAKTTAEQYTTNRYIIYSLKFNYDK